MIKLKRNIKLLPKGTLWKGSVHKIERIGDSGINLYYQIRYKDHLYWVNELDCELKDKNIND